MLTDNFSIYSQSNYVISSFTHYKTILLSIRNIIIIIYIILSSYIESSTFFD